MYHSPSAYNPTHTSQDTFFCTIDVSVGPAEEVELEWDVAVASNSNYYRAEKATHRLLDKQGKRLLVGTCTIHSPYI